MMTFFFFFFFFFAFQFLGGGGGPRPPPLDTRLNVVNNCDIITVHFLNMCDLYSFDGENSDL